MNQLFGSIWEHSLLNFVLAAFFLSVVQVSRERSLRSNQEIRRQMCTTFFLLVGAFLLTLLQEPSQALQVLGLTSVYEILPANVSLLMSVTTATRVLGDIFLIIAVVMILLVVNHRFRPLVFVFGEDVGNSKDHERGSVKPPVPEEVRPAKR